MASDFKIEKTFPYAGCYVLFSFLKEELPSHRNLRASENVNFQRRKITAKVVLESYGGLITSVPLHAR